MARRMITGHTSRWVLLLSVACLLSPPACAAHFILIEPASWVSQDRFGSPQKLGPCGDEGGGNATGEITAFEPGQTISITIDEVVFHPGHYRVALSVNDRSELPAPPVVTPRGNDPCGSVLIQDPPIFPVLADNLLPHTQPFGEPQTFTVTLPADVTCSKCTLQVLEYMSHHGAPCFYYHCADISIQAAIAPTPGATPAATATLPPTPRPACAGDCDASDDVTVDEVVFLVSITLGSMSIDACRNGDTDRNGEITIDEILRAVNHALNGCSP